MGANFARQPAQGARVTPSQISEFMQLPKIGATVSERGRFPGLDHHLAQQDDGVSLIQGRQLRFRPGLRERGRSGAPERQQPQSWPIVQEILPELVEGLIVFGGPIFDLVKDDQDRIRAQGLPERVERLPQGWILTDGPVFASGKQLAPQDFEQGARIAGVVSAGIGKVAIATNTHQPARQVRCQRGFTAAAGTFDENGGVRFQQPFHNEQFASAPQTTGGRQGGQCARQRRLRLIHQPAPQFQRRA